MKPGNKNSFKALNSININGKNYKYYSLAEAEKNGLNDISKLPNFLGIFETICEIGASIDSLD